MIADVHGRMDCLAAIHTRLDADSPNRDVNAPSEEIYLGDLVDRGPDAAGVIEALLNRAKMRKLTLLKSNHDHLFEAFLSGLFPFDRWKAMGGIQTLLSYGVPAAILRRGGDEVLTAALEAVPERHRVFLRNSLPYYCVGNYCFVHAGIRPGIPLPAQSLDDLIWIRDDFLSFQGDFGFIVVHGHTPVADVDFRHNRINLDTGAYATNKLSVLRIDRHGSALLAERDHDA